MYDKFQQLIKNKGITSYKVAKETEIPTSTFYDWKKGRSRPKVDKLIKIAEYLGVPLEELM